MKLTDVVANANNYDANNANNPKTKTKSNDYIDDDDDDDDDQKTKSRIDHSNSWTDKQEKLLAKWAEKAAGHRWLHNMARMKFKRFHDYLSYPTIILSSITGVGGFAVLNPNSSTEMSSSGKLKILVVQYLFAFMNVMTGIINSIAKFNNSQQLSEQHSAMCVQYSKFYRNIDMELSLDKNNRVNAIKFVAKCRQEYDRMLSEAPDIPYECIKLFNESFPDKEIKPDVCNGLNIIPCDTSKLEKFKLASWVKNAKEASQKRLEITV